ncbi:MAG: T9SS type A sorting domain-containing protein [Candidatus Sabulitectum sp.]|nr:T9SS type A sorting domain-containing protein [Candidatus Sabulitectum sp.]
MYSLISLSILFLSHVTFAFSATQTDWSGGYGGVGPVPFWSKFSHSMHFADYYNTPGEVSASCRANLFRDGLERMYSSTGDIDMDGDVDVAGRCQYVDGLFWLENCDLGNSWQQHFITSTGKYAWWLKLCDFDGDGDEDLLASWGEYNPNAGEIVIFENTGGVFWPEWTVAENVPGTMSSYDPFCYPIDVDGDNLIDIVGEYWTGEPPDHTLHIAWWKNPGHMTHNWVENTIYTSDIWCVVESMHAGDKDQDGDADVVLNVECVPEDSTFWIEQGGANSWILHPVEDEHVYMLGFFDFNGDSFLDILVNEGDYMYWLNETEPDTWEYTLIEDSIKNSSLTWAEDFDGDGDLDIYGSGWELSWWENIDGSGSEWEKHLLHPYQCYGNSNLSDFDLDGYTDVVLTGWNDAYWVETERYSNSAMIESQILDVGSYVYWDSITWAEDLPQGTEIYLQVRTGVDGTTEPFMEEWSEWIYEPDDLSEYVSNYRRYIQYTALLKTSDPDVTPVLQEIAVSWFGSEIDETAYPMQSSGLMTISPNPSTVPIIEYRLSGASPVEIKVFDLFGRVVFDHRSELVNSGNHEIFPGELLPGLYFCRMVSDGVTDFKSFVVIK